MNDSPNGGRRERWQLPAELRGSPPRPVRLTAAGKALAALGLALAACAVLSLPWLLAVAARDAARTQRFASEGVTTTAEVTGIRRVAGEHPEHIATYRFQVGTLDFTGRAILHRSEWRSVAEGARVPVRYLPPDPAQNWMLGHAPHGVPYWAGPVVFVSLAAMPVVLAGFLRAQMRLLSEGRTARGRVTGAGKFHRGSSSHGSHEAYKVSYEYQIMSGATRTGRYEVQKNPPAAGANLVVIYDREEPGRSARYPFRLVRIAAP